MKKIIIIFAFFAGFYNCINAQEEAIYSHYHLNPLLINPATAGFDEEYYHLFLNARSSWVAFPETPRTYSLSFNGPLTNNFGIGALLFTENLAALSRNRLQLSYSGRYNFTEDFKAAFGFSTEFHRTRITSNVVNNQLYEAGDDIIDEAIDGIRVFDVSVGVYGSYKENTYGGLTIPNLVRNKLDDINGDETGLYYIVFAVHRFDPATTSFSLEPSFAVRKVRTVPFQIDFTLKAGFLDDRLMTGLTYRTGTGGDLAILIGTNYKNLQAYYTYDVYFDDFQTYNNGSHEFTVSYRFERKEGKFDRSKKFRSDN